MLRNQNASRSRSVLLAATAIVLIAPSIGVGQIRGPVSGMIFHHASHSLRPVVGVPGSAFLGAPVLQGIDAAFIAPDGNCAFVNRESRGTLICGLVQGRQTEISIPDQIEAVDSVAWNRNGDSAVLCSTEQMLLQVIHLRGGRELARSGATVDLSPISAKPSTLAINDDGNQVALGVEGGLYRISDEGALSWAAPVGRPTGAVFGASRNTIYVLDQIAHEVRVIEASGRVNSISLTDAPDFDPEPVGLAVSDDGRKVWVAMAKQPSVRTYDTASRQLELEEALDSAPSIVQRMTSGSFYLLNSAESEGVPFLVLRTGILPATLFVPAGPACEACQ